jgi:hypothetical protein
VEFPLQVIHQTLFFSRVDAQSANLLPNFDILANGNIAVALPATVASPAQSNGQDCPSKMLPNIKRDIAFWRKIRVESTLQKISLDPFEWIWKQENVDDR